MTEQSRNEHNAQGALSGEDLERAVPPSADEALPESTLPADRTIDLPEDALADDAPQVSPDADSASGADAAAELVGSEAGRVPVGDASPWSPPASSEPSGPSESLAPSDENADVASDASESGGGETLGSGETGETGGVGGDSNGEGDASSLPKPVELSEVAEAAGPREERSRKKADSEDERPMGLLDHLGELRSRIFRGLVAVVIAFCGCYSFAGRLFEYLAMPLLKVMPTDSKFIYTGVAEGFFVELKVGFVAAIFVACPYLFYQIWAFIAPGLYDEEKKYIIPLSLFSALFFIGGAAFCYFGVFPVAFMFFLSYSTDSIVAMLSISEYLSFALKMMLAFGLIFEMPLFAFFLARMGLITAEKMRKVRKYAVLAVFIIAAILTPPDVFSQTMMAVPMLILYELSIYVAAAAGKKPKKGKKGQEPDAQPEKEATSEENA